MPDMAEKLGVGTGVRELKIGQSFLNNPRKSSTHNSKSGSSRNGASNSSRNGEESYHTIRYDFKPASSNTSSNGFLDIDEDNRVSVKIPHEGGNQTNFSGHQKQANEKDCLLIIDHVTGEITLEKVSSQIMLKKTRSEKPDAKTDSQDVTLNLPTTSSTSEVVRNNLSRPHTPSNFTKHKSGASGPNRKPTTENKVTGRTNHISSSSSTKNTQNPTDNVQSKTTANKGGNLSTDSSSDSSLDSDSDSDTISGKVEKAPKMSTSSTLTGSSGTAKYKPGPPTGSASGLDIANAKHSNQSSPSHSRVASPKPKPGGQVKQFKPVPPSITTTQGTSKMSLNDEFSDSDESDPDDPPSSTRGNEQDFSLGRFAPNSASHMGRSAPDLSQFSSNSATSAPPKKQTVSKPTTKPKQTSNPSMAPRSSAIQSMPQFLNDDLELSESDSDS